jgi:hypothetical protein
MTPITAIILGGFIRLLGLHYSMPLVTGIRELGPDPTYLQHQLTKSLTAGCTLPAYLPLQPTLHMEHSRNRDTAPLGPGP